MKKDKMGLPGSGSIQTTSATGQTSERTRKKKSSSREATTRSSKKFNFQTMSCL